MFTVQSALALPPLNGAIARDRAVVATLLYYDLFSFPLLATELERFAHGALGPGQPGGRADVCPDDLPRASEWWDSKGALWFLKGREHYTSRREALTRASVHKIERARKYAGLLQLVPGVLFIGITGSLAMHSAVPEDDIDFLIIAAPGRLWLTRALVLSALLAWGVKRPDDGRAAYPDLICANIFISADDLTIPDQNLFIAHEICQMLPLLGPETYRAFVGANQWVLDYLPQWKPAPLTVQDRPAWRALQRGFDVTFRGRPGARLERTLAERQRRRIEAKHARGHNPNVVVTPTQLRFHARDLTEYIVNTFDARWADLNHHAESAP